MGSRASGGGLAVKRADLDIRGVIALAIVLAVVGRYLVAGTVSLEDTLKSAFMVAVGYYLGSSKSSADKDRARGSRKR